MSEWIKVTDRLPADDQEVLIFDKQYGISLSNFLADDGEAGPQFYSTDGTYMPDAKVTHWMPLPDVPTG